MVNCDRGIVAPPTIKNSHRSDEILAALNEVFKGKCYLCEKKELNFFQFEIDHFLTQMERPDLKLEWTNLYLCCRSCNLSRTKSTPAGGYLDPCDGQDDVEYEILYTLPPYEFNQPLFSPRNDTPTAKVLNSIEQLKRMHYGTSTTKTKCASFREIIAKQATKLLALMHEEKEAINKQDHVLANQTAQKIEQMLDAAAPFSMLMRDVAQKYR